ncbi:MAG: hypothetical protein LBQ40_04270 [Clostridiales bacterium]|jgi:hypothetical protein|nr:hypothetical protein [Clostridiales bacterium]
MKKAGESKNSGAAELEIPSEIRQKLTEQIESEAIFELDGSKPPTLFDTGGGAGRGLSIKAGRAVNIAAFFVLIPPLILIVAICASVIANNPGDETQQMLARVGLAFFCIPILCVMAIVLIRAAIARDKAKRDKRFLAAAKGARGYVTGVAERFYRAYRQNSSGVEMVRYLVNFAYADIDGSVKTSAFRGDYAVFAAPAFFEGQEIGVATDGKRAAVMKEYAFKRKVAEQSAAGADALTDLEKRLWGLLPDGTPKPDGKVKQKAAAVFWAYMTYAAIFAAVGLGVSAHALVGMLSAEDGALKLFYLNLLPLIVLCLVLFALFFAGGIKRKRFADKIINKGRFAYGILYKGEVFTGGSFDSDYPYIFRDGNGNIGRGSVKNIFFRMKYVEFDPLYKTLDKRGKRGKRKKVVPFTYKEIFFRNKTLAQSSVYKAFMPVVVAYSDDGSVIV